MHKCRESRVGALAYLLRVLGVAALLTLVVLLARHCAKVVIWRVAMMQCDEVIKRKEKLRETRRGSNREQKTEDSVRKKEAVEESGKR